MTDRPAVSVALVAVPEVTMSTLSGIYDALNSFEHLGTFDAAVPDVSPFRVEIVGSGTSSIGTASGLPVQPHRTIDETEHADVVIVPSLILKGAEWKTGRYPSVVAWMCTMHDRGALLCSACSGVLLLAETGLLDGRDATIHWAYARTFGENFPEVRLGLDKTLVVAGDRQELVMSGASASWHDLVLYLVARQVGPAAATAITKFMLLQWHEDGQAPYVVFTPVTDHGDAAVLEAQLWLHDHFSVAAPVQQVVDRSELAERTFKRRFTRATGHTPIRYVQALRLEEAKRLLERTEEPVEAISWTVGYEDPSSFRRLFKRATRLTPGAYRRKFRLPGPGRHPADPAPAPGGRARATTRA